MSVFYTPINWNKNKKRYDLILLGMTLSLILCFGGSAYYFHPEITIETLMIRGSSIAAFILLHLALSIGPLTRIDARFLPLLYNRRHLGVLICLLGCFHAVLSIFQFHALGNIPARLSVLTSYTSEFAFWGMNGNISEIPFEPFGLIALFILIFMAATSHDFWLKNLGAANWKKIHVLIYVAYALLVIHVSYGLFQSERNSFFVMGLVFGMLWLVSLHLLAFRIDSKRSAKVESASKEGFYKACLRSELVEGRAKIVEIEGLRIALFLYQGKVSAISNTCRHQGGPLGEGRIIDGCVTCPWHGWQYRPNDGSSPPPFKEVVPTFAVRLEENHVFVNPTERLADSSILGGNPK